MAEIYFKKVFKGYEPAQVDEFIVSLSDRYQQNEQELEEKIRIAEAEIDRLNEEISRMNLLAEQTVKEHENELSEQRKETDALCAEIGEKMVVADKRAAEIIKNAEKEAALILTQARQQGENEAKALRSKAAEEAEKLVEETRKQCESISQAAEEFRAKQNEMNKSITETESRFANALSKLAKDIGNGD